MIASVSGTVQAKSLDAVVVEAGGIGYLIHTTPAALATLRVGQQTSLTTAFIVREDYMSLFGFTDTAHRDLFDLVRTVTGVGARLALAIVGSYPDVNEFAAALRNEDHAGLTRVPGIGKRTAQRLVVELKDKVDGVLDAHGLAVPATAAGAGVGAPAAVNEVVEGLIGLGFSEREARSAAEAAVAESPAAETPVLLRHALTALGRKR